MKRMCDRYGDPLEGSVMAKAIEVGSQSPVCDFRANLFPHFLKWDKGNCWVSWDSLGQTPVLPVMQTIAWRHEWEAAKTPCLQGRRFSPTTLKTVKHSNVW